MSSRRTHSGEDSPSAALNYADHRTTLLRDQLRPTFVIVIGLVLLQLTIHRANVTSWQEVVLESYFVVLLVPIVSLALTYLPASPAFSSLLAVLFDAGFTLGVLSFIPDTVTSLSAVTIALCLKMLASAILIPWAPRFQLVSVLVTIGLYAAAVWYSSYAVLATHQIISPVLAGILATYGARRLDESRRNLFHYGRGLEASERNLRAALSKERILLGVVNETVHLDELNSTLARLNRATAEATASDFSATFLIHPEDDSIELASLHHAAGSTTKAVGTRFKDWQGGRLEKAMSTGKTIAISHPHDQNILPPELLLEAGVEVIAFSPILNQGRTLGVLLAGRLPGSPGFTQDEVALLAGIAAHTGSTINNARLYRELAASEAAYRDLFERANDLIFVLDTDGKIHFANQAALSFFDLTAETTREVHWPDLLSSGELLRITRHVQLHKSSGAVQSDSLEVRVDHPLGDTAILEIRTREISAPGAHPKHYQCIARDVSERKRRDEETRALLNRLQESNRLQEEFVANMSHELRTPLNVIIGYTDLISDSLSLPVDSGARSYLDRIAAASRALHRMVESILEYARLDRGRMKVIPTSFSSEHLLLELQGLCNDVRSSSDVDLIIEEEDAIELTTDYDRLYSLLSNLMLNALKFTPKGSVTLRLRRDGNDAVFDISDTGIGIEASEIGAVFEPFRQADGSDTRVFGGVGLGLAIVRRNVDLLHGTVDVDSAPNRGSRFHVRVPIVLDLPASSAA